MEFLRLTKNIKEKDLVLVKKNEILGGLIEDKKTKLNA